MARKHSKSSVETDKENAILTFNRATIECELVINPVRKETGRCHEPETQKEG